MAKNIEVYPLLSDEQLPERQLEVAKGVKLFVYEDLRRVGATETEARSVADPDDETQVDDQLRRMLFPSVEGTQYLGVYADEEWRGIAKVGPWLPGDESNYGKRRGLSARVSRMMGSLDTLPSGLHAFAVKEGLAKAALEAIYFDYVPDGKKLKASVHEGDEELQAAFTDLGAPDKGPVAQIKLGGYAANYALRVLSGRR
jgi:hypothetical protein